MVKSNGSPVEPCPSDRQIANEGGQSVGEAASRGPGPMIPTLEKNHRGPVWKFRDRFNLLPQGAGACIQAVHQEGLPSLTSVFLQRFIVP